MERRRRIIVQRDTPQRDLANKVDEESIYVRDGGDIPVLCSNCDAPLAELWITRPEMQIKSEVVVDCPHCGDKSFIIEVSGKFHLGHTEFTTIVNQEMEVDTTEDNAILQMIHFLTEKGDKPYE